MTVLRWAPEAEVPRAVLGVPFVLLIPGHALLLATGGWSVDAGWRLLLTLAMSLASAIAAVLLLQAVGGRITGERIATVLAILVVVATLAGAMWPRADRGVPTGSLSQGALWSLTAALALVVCVAAVMVLSRPVENDRTAPYTQLWAIRSSSGSVRIGVRSFEKQDERYRLRIQEVGGAGETRMLDLRPGQTWRHTRVGRGKERPQLLTITLSKATNPDVPYRRVLLRA
jgi:hypothetical protein